jgi:hypothetical protein
MSDKFLLKAPAGGFYKAAPNGGIGFGDRATAHVFTDKISAIAKRNAIYKSIKRVCIIVDVSNEAPA